MEKATNFKSTIKRVVGKPLHEFEMQYFHTLLQIATDRFVERITQRQEGAKNALKLLQADPYGEGVWLDKFVDAFFEEFLLNNPAGSSFILRALAQRTYDARNMAQKAATVENLLERMAKDVFMQLLKQKVEEALEQSLVFGG